MVSAATMAPTAALDGFADAIGAVPAGLGLTAPAERAAAAGGQLAGARGNRGGHSRMPG